MPAHLIYARFPSAEHRAARAWERAVDDVLSLYAGDVAAPRGRAVPPGPITAWRLVSENHREIARSARVFAAERPARAHAATVIRRAGELTLHSAAEPDRRTTGWFAALDNRLVMVGARRYESRAVARQAALLAVDLLTGLGGPPADGESLIF